ncbi:hypothetical protein [Pseudoxanthomonas sp.]|uniref:hypothetical protein n=1 Tax=Pseudoxanthomonas sp. TaxID=1871049 RepID=UPI002623B635|nr:hypothetical protein [Pseudoxanthomonas sp.]WDS36590.1 MAG: hypothetical protein O8I58_01305 [Pseudoxanthomonas sp.]
MKRLTVLTLSLLLACAATNVAHATDEDALPAAWTTLGIKVGMPYAKAKALLLGAGWKAAAPDHEGAPAIAGNPEVDCGEGWQAVCSAGYDKDREQYAIVLTPTDDGKLLVQGTY